MDVKLDRVVVLVKDFERSLSFYRDMLGLPLTRSWDRPDSKGALFGVGDSAIEILWVPGGKNNEACDFKLPFSKIHINLQVDDVDGCYSDLKKRGAPITEEPEDTFWGARLFRLNDPDGVHIVFLKWLT